ncbi:hypothetical protein [Pseudonocardia sp. T1-2H]|uniref:hypothetical protein n=1 Tax=Pseudonocardia sp. T1-2H TaxID=3128899 RepID=UPI0031016F25
MRSIPVDIARVALIGTGKASPKAEYVQLSDGQTRRSGNQATDGNGMPLWTVDVLVDDDDAVRSEVIGVTVPAYEEPIIAKFQPVQFRNVVAKIYTDRASGQAKVSLVAEGLMTPAKASAS